MWVTSTSRARRWPPRMLNALGWSHSIRERGVLRTSTGQGKIAFIHPDDIADVAIAALIMQGHDNQSFVITGPEALSYGEMAAAIGGAIGKRVRFEEISDQQAYAGVVRWAGKGPVRGPARRHFGVRCAKASWLPSRTE
jgi:uncharacterized protein YbjT (DUF2867 family)